jgi:Protein of unknown function (DUF3579)
LHFQFNPGALPHVVSWVIGRDLPLIEQAGGLISMQHKPDGAPCEILRFAWGFASAGLMLRSAEIASPDPIDSGIHDRTAMRLATNEFAIRGVTLAGKVFRPSDWADRLCGVMAQCGADRRMQCSPYVWQALIEGVAAVVVDGRLEDVEPMGYRFLMNFARDNELEIRIASAPKGSRGVNEAELATQV